MNESKKVNNIKKPLLAVLIIVAVLLIGAVAYARIIKKPGQQAKPSAINANPNGRQNIPKIEPKLSNEEIEKFQEMATMNENILRSRVQYSVNTKKITQDQANMILGKLDEIVDFNEELKTKTRAERNKMLNDKRVELKTWAEQSGIPRGFLSNLLTRI